MNWIDELKISEEIQERAILLESFIKRKLDLKTAVADLMIGLSCDQKEAEGEFLQIINLEIIAHEGGTGI